MTNTRELCTQRAGRNNWNKCLDFDVGWTSKGVEAADDQDLAFEKSQTKQEFNLYCFYLFLFFFKGESQC